MRLIRAQIYGFGKWIDYELQFKDHGPSYFYGENEAGKSTLQQFILYMLFGLPPRKLNEFKPKESSKIGGAITVQFADETVTIERVDRHVQALLPNGDVIEGDEYIQKKMNGLTHDLYRAIYAFSSLDLMELHNIKKHELSDLLFSVGLVGSSAVYDVEKVLEKKSGALFRKNARKPAVNEQITIVKNAYDTVEASRVKEATYRLAIEKKENLEMKLKTITASIKETNDKKIYLQKVLSYIDTIEKYKTDSEKLQHAPENIDFPEDGITRYQALKDKLIPLKSAKKVIDDKRTNYLTKMNELINEQIDEHIYVQAKQLNEQKSIELKRKEQIRELEREINQLEAILEDRLAQVNMTEDEIKATTFPFQIEMTWKKLIDEEVTLKHRSDRLTDQFEKIEEERQQIEAQLKNVQAKMLDDGKIRILEEKLAEHENKLYQAPEKSARKAKLFALVFGVGGLITSGLAIYNSRIEFFIITLLFIALFAYQIGVSRNRSKDVTVDSEPESSTIEREKIKNELKENEQRKIEEAFLQEQLVEITKQKESVQLEIRTFTEDEHDWQNKVLDERVAYPFLSTIEPRFWLDLLSYIKELKKFVADKAQLIAKLTAIKRESETFHHSSKQIIEQAGAYDGDVFNSLEQIVVSYEQNKQAIAQFSEHVEEFNNEIAETTTEIRMIEAEIEKLFVLANAKNEEEYFQAAELKESKAQLEDSVAASFAILKRVFQLDELNELFRSSLNETNLEKEMSHLKSIVQDLEMEKDDIQREIVNVTHLIEELELSEDYSLALHTYEREKGKLNEQAKKWAMYTIAQEALTQAKHTLQEKYFHDVIRHTTAYFKHLTNDQYMNVFAPTDTEPFQVEAKNRIRYTVNELSKGTVDQLYFALRLAISKVMSHKYNVPIILDDAMIHFDEKRTMKALQLIEEIAEAQQVLLFTCRAHIAQQIEKERLNVLA